jgi:hypothetical protein
MIIYCILTALILVPLTQPLRASCSKPDAPSCATSYGKFDDQTDLEICKREMEEYRSDVEHFLDCQKQETREAVDEYKEAVETFKDRAGD